MNDELIKKAKQAASVAELMEIAKSENIELTEENAKKLFDSLHSEGELEDAELDSVAGGGCGTPDYLTPTYSEGDVVAVKSQYRCNVCGCEFGKISRVLLAYSNSQYCRFDYTLYCTNCGNQFEVDEKKYSNQNYFCNKSDIIGRLS